MSTDKLSALWTSISITNIPYPNPYPISTMDRKLCPYPFPAGNGYPWIHPFVRGIGFLGASTDLRERRAADVDEF
jgi:hypothetical protein